MYFKIKTMKQLLYNHNQTISKLEEQIRNCKNQDELFYLNRALNEANKLFCTLAYINQ